MATALLSLRAKRSNLDYTKESKRLLERKPGSNRQSQNEENRKVPSNKPLKKAVIQKVDLLRARTVWLNGKDKLLMKMYLDNGSTFRQMARLANVNESTIARRIYKIVKRLLDAHYLAVLGHSDKFSLLQMEIVQDYFIRGLTKSRIAAEHGCSRYYVNKTLLKVQSLSENKNVIVSEAPLSLRAERSNLDHMKKSKPL